MAATYGTYVDPETGKKYPACKYCGIKLSDYARGSGLTRAIIDETVKTYMDHIWQAHPDKVDGMMTEVGR